MDPETDERPKTGQPGETEPKWVEVAVVGGGAPAAMTVEFLQAHGIQAWSWQEGAGDALGLTVGLLGSAHIMVPESEAELAGSLLEEPGDVEESEATVEEEETAGEPTSELTRAVLAAAAFVLSPVMTGLTFLLAPFMRSKREKDDLFLMSCPGCGVDLEITEAEIVQGSFVCPECGQTNRVD